MVAAGVARMDAQNTICEKVAATQDKQFFIGMTPSTHYSLLSLSLLPNNSFFKVFEIIPMFPGYAKTVLKKYKIYHVLFLTKYASYAKNENINDLIHMHHSK